MEVFIPEYLYGVIGWPLAQTLSPLVHNAGFQYLKIPSVYMAWPITPHDLSPFMGKLNLIRIQGLSVTIPHKVEIIRYCAILSQSAQLAGAVNTLFWSGDNICGDNTDVTGFLLPLKNILSSSLSVLLLGAGGAARAAASGLKMAGVSDVTVTSPGNKRQYELAERFEYKPILWEQRYHYNADIIINATPLGMVGELINDTPYDFAKAPKMQGWAYDLVYNPVMTRFLKEAKNTGREIITGVEMFFGQANAQFKLWTKKDLPENAKKALENSLN